MVHEQNMLYDLHHAKQLETPFEMMLTCCRDASHQLLVRAELRIMTTWHCFSLEKHNSLTCCDTSLLIDVKYKGEKYTR